MAVPVPIGPGASFSNVGANKATASFSFDEGRVVVTFQPVNVNDPGVATLYDSADTAILTLDEAGHANHVVPRGGATYYLKATKGANVLAVTRPTIWR